jgi:hypothetical protein
VGLIVNMSMVRTLRRFDMLEEEGLGLERSIMAQSEYFQFRFVKSLRREGTNKERYK